MRWASDPRSSSFTSGRSIAFNNMPGRAGLLPFFLSSRWNRMSINVRASLAWLGKICLPLPGGGEEDAGAVVTP